jgi:hypothetical protein
MFLFLFYASLLKRKTKVKIVFTSIKTHTIIIKAVLKTAAKFLFRQSFSVIGTFILSGVHLILDAGKSAKTYQNVIGGFGTKFEDLQVAF